MSIVDQVERPRYQPLWYTCPSLMSYGHSGCSQCPKGCVWRIQPIAWAAGTSTSALSLKQSQQKQEFLVDWERETKMPMAVWDITENCILNVWLENNVVLNILGEVEIAERFELLSTFVIYGIWSRAALQLWWLRPVFSLMLTLFSILWLKKMFDIFILTTIQ